VSIRPRGEDVKIPVHCFRYNDREACVLRDKNETPDGPIASF
jgi:hypothetical protein